MMFDSPAIAHLFERLSCLIKTEPDRDLFEILVSELEKEARLETVSDRALIRRYEELEEWFPFNACA